MSRLGRFHQIFYRGTLTALAVSSLSHAFGQDDTPPTPSHTSRSISDVAAPSFSPPPSAAPKMEDAALYAAVDAAMAYSQSQTPDLHAQAIRIWGRFKKGDPQPNYTYRYWARNIIIWLKKNKNIAFDKMEKIVQVFTYLYSQKKISDAAAVVLASDTWSYLVHLEGVPDWERKLPGDQDAKMAQEEISA